MLKHRRVLEFFEYNKRGDTDHNVFKDGNHPLDYSPDCWCEPRITMCKGLKLWGHKYKGWSRVILHDGKWYKPTFAPTNKLNAIYDSLEEPPEGGWDSIMDQEQVEELLEAVNKYQHKDHKLVQRKNESVHDYYQRVKAAINSGITEFRYETNDPEAFSELLERDDDFETEIDEEE